MSLLLLATLGLALGQDATADADDDDFDFLEEGDRNAERLAAEAAEREGAFDMYADEEDDFEMDFELARTRPNSYRLPVTTDGMKPLADNYPVRLVVGQMGSLVLELPVLVSAGGPAPDTTYWLVGQVYVGDNRVAETRHWVNAQSTVRGGPTVAFLKMHAPVTGEEGELQVRVSQIDEAGTTTELFTREVLWTLQ
jgi:hypothetical protein